MLSINIERVDANSRLIMTRVYKISIFNYVSFCSYLLFFLNLKYKFDIKKYLTNFK